MGQPSHQSCLCRDQILLRMAKDKIEAPPTISRSPDGDIESNEAREHKMLGGLNFKWRLLFHAGTKPTKNQTPSPSKGAPESSTAEIGAAAGTASKASCCGA